MFVTITDAVLMVNKRLPNLTMKWKLSQAKYIKQSRNKRNMCLILRKILGAYKQSL